MCPLFFCMHYAGNVARPESWVKHVFHDIGILYTGSGLYFTNSLMKDCQGWWVTWFTCQCVDYSSSVPLLLLLLLKLPLHHHFLFFQLGLRGSQTFRPHATCHLSHFTCSLPPVTCHLSPATCHLPPVTCQLPLDSFHLVTASCHLPTANYWLPHAIYYLQKMPCKKICKFPKQYFSK